MVASSEGMLVRREMTDLEDEVWDDPDRNVLHILVSHRRTGAPEDVLTGAVRTPAEMWASCLAEFIGDGAADLECQWASTMKGPPLREPE
jgi:hypothetical protein